MSCRVETSPTPARPHLRTICALHFTSLQRRWEFWIVQLIYIKVHDGWQETGISFHMSSRLVEYRQLTQSRNISNSRAQALFYQNQRLVWSDITSDTRTLMLPVPTIAVWQTDFDCIFVPQLASFGIRMSSDTNNR